MIGTHDDDLESIERSWIENYAEQIDFINHEFKIYQLRLKVARRWRFSPHQQYHKWSSSATPSASDSATSSSEDKEGRRLQR